MSASGNAVFVTGATGLVGAATIDALRQRDQEVVAAVRPHSTLKPRPGLELREFDFSMSPGEIEHAMVGCDRLFLMRPPAIEDVERYLFPVIEAALRLQFRQIVFLSLQGVQHNRKTPHHAVEQYLTKVKAPYTFLRPNFFMQNLSTTYAHQIREHDEIFVPAGRSYTAFIDTRDVGNVASAVLTCGGHNGKAYTLSGEKALSYRAVAGILSDVLDRDIHYARPSEHRYLTRLAQEGMPEDYIEVQRMIYRVVRLNVSAFPNRMVRKLTGMPATTFREFAERERSRWQK